MKIISCGITVLVLMGLTIAFGDDYPSMKEEWANYTIPAYVDTWRDSVTDTFPNTDNQTFDMSGESADSLERLKASWSQILADQTHDEAFLPGDSGISKAMKPVAADNIQTVAVLKDGYSLDTLLALTLLRNPGIHAAVRRVQAALESYTQVTNLDAILARYAAFTESLMTGVGPMKGNARITKSFPFPGVMALKGEVVTQDVAVMREELDLARREAVVAVEKAYWNLLYNDQSQRIIMETVSLFRQLESVANTRYSTGSTSFQDVIKVNIQTRIMEENQVTYVEERRSIEAKIRELLDLPADTVLGSPEIRKPRMERPDLNQLYPLAREKRQELRRMRDMVGKMERMIQMGETMILPQLTLGLSYFSNDAIVQVGSAAMKPAFPTRIPADMGAGLPRQPWFGTGDAWLRQTRENLNAARLELEKAERVTDRMVQEAWFALDRAIRETKLYRDKVAELSRSALEVSTRGYESGSVGFADVMASHTNWLHVRQTLSRKQRDIGVARADMVQVLGTRAPQGVPEKSESNATGKRSD